MSILIIGIIVLFNLSQVDAVSGEIIQTPSPYMSYIESTYRIVCDIGEKEYKEGVKWYKENNNIVTIFPYVLTVHILDFFFILIGLLFLFLTIIRYLSK